MYTKALISATLKKENKKDTTIYRITKFKGRFSRAAKLALKSVNISSKTPAWTVWTGAKSKNNPIAKKINPFLFLLTKRFIFLKKLKIGLNIKIL